MTAAQPLRADPPAAAQAEARDRLAHVVGAAGRVTAAAGEERRERDLVDANQRERDAARHGLSSLRACRAAVETPPRCDRKAHRVARGAARPRRRAPRWVCCDETTR